MVNEINRVGDLEVNEDLTFQRRSWVMQRVGWVVMTLVMLAALVGLFGGAGALGGEAQSSSEDAAVSVSYERFLRFIKPTTLQIQLSQEAGKGGKVSVWVDREYLDGLQVQQITPQPSSAKTGAKRLTYVFEVDDPNGPAMVTFDLLPEQEIGALRGRVGVGDGEPVSFGQFVYP
jgi:hypothetical protein